ncbi:hypothetical protein M8J75_011975 [Diaphorina citri]|nr:hypothetical protein M8J75_011975 [Diaphorina citri]KAI5739357.1 hypothetical protein M8J77_018315 [Diaphorina citri]
MSLCNSCNRDLPVDGGYVVCGVCGGGLHYNCTTVSEASWRSMSNPTKAKWRCGECRGRSNYLLQRSDSSGSLSGNLTDGGLNQENRKKDEIITLSKMEALLDRKFKMFKNDVEKSLEYLGGTLEDLSKTFKELERKVVLVEKNQEKLENQNIELRKKVKDLEILVQDMAQEGNKNKLEITGVPQNVDYVAYTEKIFEKIKVNQVVKKEEYHVEKITVKKPNSPPQVKSLVVTLKNNQIRDSVLETLKRDKPRMSTADFINQQPALPIFINEYLSPYLKKLFYEAKKIKGDKNYEYLWVKNGQILLKKTAGGKVMRLTSMEDLGKI